MSTIAIVAIVVVALIIIALLAFVLPRMRSRARVRAREKELQDRRERVAGEHRAEAEQREREAAQAEQKARIAAKEAEAQRAQAELHQERAGLHERGMADHELIEDHERERFEGTSATQAPTDDGMRDDERGTLDADRRGTTTGGAVAAGSAGRDMDDYDRGRQDEAMERDGRFARSETPAEERETTR
jgi:FtsZ-interacting cell division protein ZipA